jgi:hypothetical protein
METIKMFWQVIESDFFLSCYAYAITALFLSCFALFIMAMFVESDNWQEEAGL